MAIDNDRLCDLCLENAKRMTVNIIEKDKDITVDFLESISKEFKRYPKFYEDKHSEDIGIIMLNEDDYNYIENIKVRPCFVMESELEEHIVEFDDVKGQYEIIIIKINKIL